MIKLDSDSQPYAFNDATLDDATFSEYTGFGDDQLDFGGDQVDFASELAGARSFQLVLQNGNATIARVSLGAAMIPLPGTTQISEGMFIEPVGTGTGVIATGSPESYDFLKKFIERNPSRLVALKVLSDNELQLAQSLVVRHVSPFENLGSRQIPLASFTRESAFNVKMLTLKNLDLQLDNQTDISLAIPGNTTTTLTLYVGAILNNSKTLAARASLSKRSAAVQASKI